MTKVTTINILALKPEHVDDYVAMQKDFTAAVSAGLSGLAGGRLYRSVEGSKVVLVSEFESREAQAAVLGSPELAAHIARLRPFVESSNPDLYVEAYSYGPFK